MKDTFSGFFCLRTFMTRWIYAGAASGSGSKHTGEEAISKYQAILRARCGHRHESESQEKKKKRKRKRNGAHQTPGGCDRQRSGDVRPDFVHEADGHGLRHDGPRVLPQGRDDPHNLSLPVAPLNFWRFDRGGGEGKGCGLL